MINELTIIAQALTPNKQQALLDYARRLAAQQVASPEAKLQDTGNIPTESNHKRGKGWVEVKTINGHQYAYRRWREGKILKSEYIGKVSS